MGNSKSDAGLHNILESIVPSKSYLAAKGNAFHEYVSTLSQISRVEVSPSEHTVRNRRNQRR